MLAELSKLMPPPIEPVGVGSTDQRQEVERELGMQLPEDYWQFISIYGEGTIDDRFRIVNAFEKSSIFGFYDQYRYLTDTVPLLPWGYNFERGTAFWETRDVHPLSWTVYTEFDDDVQRFPEGMTTFLVKTLRGDHLSSVLFNEANPFIPPIPFYPVFDPAMVRVVLGRSDRAVDEQIDLILNMFSTPAVGREVVFQSFRELQAKVPRLGWSIRYRSYAARTERGALHELELAVPRSEVQTAMDSALTVAENLCADVMEVEHKSH